MSFESSPRLGQAIIVLAFACFIALGIVNGLLGVAWPSIQSDFGLSLDAIGALLISSTIGFAGGSILASKFLSRRGLVPFLLAANGIAALALYGYALSPAWMVMVALGLLAGFGSGSIDTGLNIYVAGGQSVRTMNWMHACFGIGAALGPLIMTAVVTSDLSWRWGYAVAASVQLILALAYIPLLGRAKLAQPARGAAREADDILNAASPNETLRLLAVWLAVLLFFLYTGVEATAGNWTFTLFTESRSVSASAAGILTSVFWAMLTLGRIVFGAAATKIGINRLLRLSMAATLMASILVVIGSVWTGFVGIALMGLSLSAIFPTLTAETPRRVGIGHAANTIGYQTGAAAVGFAVLPGLAGALAARAGLESIAWVLVVGSLLMLLVNEWAIRLARRDLTRRIAEQDALAS